MLTQRMKKLKEEEEGKGNYNASGEQQQQLSEDEQEEIRKEKEAMKLVLQIPLVVEEMMGYLKHPDLKTSRCVSAMWRETATSIMLKKDCSQVKLIYNKKNNKFRKDVGRGKVQGADYLSELTKLFRKPLTKKTTVNKFPCSTFTIKNGSLGNPQILEFFTSAGQQVKILTLISNDSTFDPFREILEGHCQNVETLHMYRQFFQWDENDVQLELPKLRVLSMGDYRQCGCCGNRGTVGYKILKTIIAPNLEIIKDFDLGEDTNAIVEAGKVHAVKELCMTNVDEETRSYPRLLQALTNAGPQLESISLMMFGDENDFEIDWEWMNSMADPLQQLLNASKDTLKIFQFTDLGFLFKDIKLPRFSKLTELKIEELGHDPVRIFPIRINLAETFPNVTTINLSSINLNQEMENWDKYFPPPDAYRGELTSVTRVQVSRECSQNVKDNLRLICPNAEFVY